MAHEPHTVPCRDSVLGRAQTTTVRLDGESGRAVVIVPRPAGTYDHFELDRFIQALVDVRGQMSGESR